MVPTRDKDLATLIDDAEREAAATARGRSRSDAPRPRRSRLPTAVALAAAAAFGAHELWAHYFAPTAAKVTRDLEHTVDLARDSIEESRKRIGALPEALPNASLAAVVAYESRNTSYRLSASMGGVRVVIDWDGSRSIDRGEGN